MVVLRELILAKTRFISTKIIIIIIGTRKPYCRTLERFKKSNREKLTTNDLKTQLARKLKSISRANKTK